MGVTGLWKLIDPCGKPVPLETLEGKILAVDISIWLHQVIKGFQDNKGAALNNAHLLGLFHRLCKLLYYRIKPIFIFDGCVPQLKKDTMARRQQQRSKLNNEAERIQALLLQNLAQEQMVQQALGPNAVDLLLTSPMKRLAAATKKSTNKQDLKDDMFKLPDIPEEEETAGGEDLRIKKHNKDESNETEENCSFSGGSAEEDPNTRYIYNTNLQAIDVRSQHFRNLPADIRHEILVDIKETRKQSSWGRLHELPSSSDDFSLFQMKRLLKRRDVQVSLEEAEKDMGGRSLTYAELNELFTEDGIVDSRTLNKGTRQLCSDEHTRFLLVKDLKKKLSQEIKCENENGKEPKELNATQQECAISKGSKGDYKMDNVNNDDENDVQLKNDINLAIALSLAETNTPTKVYDAKDYDYESEEIIKLTTKQKEQLKHTTKGPARTYMIEYAGMNKDEVDEIMEKTQLNSSMNSILEELLPSTLNGIEENERREDDNYVKVKSLNLIDSNIQDKNTKQIIEINDDDDETDSDLEEVVEDVHTLNKPTGLNILLTVDKILQPDEEDLFADAFENTEDCINKDICKDKDNESTEDCIKLQNKEIHKNNDNEFENTEDHIKLQNKDIYKDKDNETELLKRLQQVQNTANDVKLILNQLKQQVDNVKNIKLDDIKLNENDTGVLEISDDECSNNNHKINSDTIEICDNSSPKSVIQTKHNKCKLLNVKTPTKTHTITDYFKMDYVIKRTPDKPTTDGLTTPPKVTSPFFIKKTPNSEKKKSDDSLPNSPSTSMEKISKVNKKLFAENVEKVTENDAQEIMKKAVKVLNEEKSNAELENVAESLARERQNLEQLRNRQERMGLNITQRMSLDCQDLLKLFGIPYLVAPMEAEAQCAFLDAVQLTNGTITDDSDIWLFGGRTVYKNFFAQNKYVLEFQADEIEKNFHCNRNKLIQLACLVGSDYTTGINGIGTVTALEILAQFSHTSPDDRKNNDATITSACYISKALEKFRNWWLTFKKSSGLPGSSSRLALQKKLKNIELSEGFPNLSVIEAYLTPTIDDNTETFSWGQPDIGAIREFTRQTFGWTQQKTDSILLPVIKKLNDKKTQLSILKYLTVKDAGNIKELAVSKRVKKAIEKMHANMCMNNSVNDDGEHPEKDMKPPKAKRVKKTNTSTVPKTINKVGRKQKKALEAISNCNIMEKEKSAFTTKKTTTKRSSKEIISQREKNLAQMEANKKFAAEVLKNAKQQQQHVAKVKTKTTKKQRIDV